VFPVEGAGLFHEHRVTPERVISVAAKLKANKVQVKVKVTGQEKLNTHHFLPRDTMHKHDLCRHVVSVCLCIRHVRELCQN